MTDGFPGRSAVTAADDEDPFGIGMKEHRDMDDAFMVHEFIFNRRLEDAIQDQHAAKFLRIGNDDILKIGMASIQDIRDFRRQIQVRRLVFCYKFFHSILLDNRLFLLYSDNDFILAYLTLFVAVHFALPKRYLFLLSIKNPLYHPLTE
ncbi:hypothetical protein HMPREF3201_00340 [Megasphaera sp. MJR8396C]|nr:hypothetical protein HMPREF3201_00340 [Megasphaera sp. MJR8396C]